MPYKYFSKRSLWKGCFFAMVLLSIIGAITLFSTARATKWSDITSFFSYDGMHEFKGKPKEVNETTTFSSDDIGKKLLQIDFLSDIKDKIDKTVISKYSKNGKIEETSIYSKTGTREQAEFWEYQSGKIFSYKKENYGKIEESVTEKYTYEFTKDDNLFSDVYFYSEVVNFVDIFEEIEKEKILEKTDISFIVKTCYYNNNDGKQAGFPCKEIRVFDEEEREILRLSLSKKQKYEYGYNNKLKESQTDFWEDLHGIYKSVTEKYKYSSEGQIRKKNTVTDYHISKSDTELAETFTYDAKGNVKNYFTEYSAYAHSDLPRGNFTIYKTKESSYKYDKNNNLKSIDSDVYYEERPIRKRHLEASRRQLKIEDSAESIKIKYGYDDNGNWIKRKVNIEQNGKNNQKSGVLIQERIITYY